MPEPFRAAMPKLPTKAASGTKFAWKPKTPTGVVSQATYEGTKLKTRSWATK